MLINGRESVIQVLYFVIAVASIVALEVSTNNLENPYPFTRHGAEQRSPRQFPKFALKKYLLNPNRNVCYEQGETFVRTSPVFLWVLVCTGLYVSSITIND